MMEKRKLGHGGPEVSILGFGCLWMNHGWGPAAERAEMVAAIRTAAERGVTLFDAAEANGPFANEELLAEALAPWWGKVLIATKFGFDLSIPGLNSRPEFIRKSVELSLKRLKTDCIDLYYQHRVDPSVPMEDLAGAVKDLVAAGKVKYFGLCEAAPDLVRRAHAVHPVAVVRTEYSLWDRAAETELVPALEALGVGLISRSPLGPALHKPDGVTAALGRVGQQYNASPAQVGLAWLLGQKTWVVPVPGARQVDRTLENLGSANIRLSSADLRTIEDAFSRASLRRHSAHDDSRLRSKNGTEF